MEQTHTSTGRRPYARNPLGTHRPRTGRAERELPRSAERERELPEGVERAELRVMDHLGRSLANYGLDLTNNVFELPLNTAVGTIVCGLYADGLLWGTTKVEVVR